MIDTFVREQMGLEVSQQLNQSESSISIRGDYFNGGRGMWVIRFFDAILP